MRSGHLRYPEMGDGQLELVDIEHPRPGLFDTPGPDRGGPLPGALQGILAVISRRSHQPARGTVDQDAGVAVSLQALDLRHGPPVRLEPPVDLVRLGLRP